MRVNRNGTISGSHAAVNLQESSVWDFGCQIQQVIVQRGSLGVKKGRPDSRGSQAINAGHTRMCPGMVSTSRSSSPLPGQQRLPLSAPPDRPVESRESSSNLPVVG